MSYKTVYQGGQGEITEKKSRFIATVRPVESESEALAFIAEMKKKYWDARHNCWAYVIGEQSRPQRASDDGEPQGTAGRPMLDVLLGEEVHNAAVVVTRYFGGVLLGTGGLVRAYQGAVQAGLAASVIIEKRAGILLTLQTDYNGVGKIQYQLGQRGLVITDSAYTDAVRLTTLVPAEDLDGVLDALTEATSGRVKYLDKTPVTFAFADGEPLLF